MLHSSITCIRGYYIFFCKKCNADPVVGKPSRLPVYVRIVRAAAFSIPGLFSPAFSQILLFRRSMRQYHKGIYWQAFPSDSHIPPRLRYERADNRERQDAFRYPRGSLPQKCVFGAFFPLRPFEDTVCPQFRIPPDIHSRFFQIPMPAHRLSEGPRRSGIISIIGFAFRPATAVLPI